MKQFLIKQVLLLGWAETELKLDDAVQSDVVLTLCTSASSSDFVFPMCVK